MGIFEPQHYKTNKITCAPSKDSDQPAHARNLIRVFACVQWVAKDPSFLHADSEDSDQTGRMRTGHFVGFVMLQLIWINVTLQTGERQNRVGNKGAVSDGQYQC